VRIGEFGDVKSRNLRMLRSENAKIREFDQRNLERAALNLEPAALNLEHSALNQECAA
jgi:hypothetical protein